ncbi:cvnh domain-containing protein [Colletotrichum plurivorum]|uniref:Cvnh domain-containing protein n=1 Tax=Colletotrichum plurivorum TaxID=2175906 RepID=A0A8H6KLD7_9PEZI|nr:cvnh domain-containing protein [Colletotrichum plurivorum]
MRLPALGPIAPIIQLTTQGFLQDGCGYINSGDKFTLRADGSITTYCNDKVCGARTYTALNLNDCVANVLGDLKAKPEDHPNGNFWETCKECDIDDFHMKCKCRTLLGIYKDTSIDVNSVVTNWNGYLSCGGGISNCYTVNWMCKPANWWPEGSPPEIFTTECDIRTAPPNEAGSESEQKC